MGTIRESYGKYTGWTSGASKQQKAQQIAGLKYKCRLN